MYPDGESDGLSEQGSDCEDEEDSSSGYSTDEKHTNLPKVTLTSLTETGQDESTIPVLDQRSYTGRNVIPSALANTLCADLGVNGVLEELNTTLGTSYPLDSVISILESYIAQNVDFGTAYAYLRQYWNDIPTVEDKLRTREVEDREMRLNVLVDGRITKRDMSPRRVWDLCANRVVPYWVACHKPCGISHAWVDEKDRVNMMTSINRGEWPVPMPNDVHLDLIRIEMLNARTWSDSHLKPEYAWLDVLCLRQEGGKNEHLRLDEWKLDVPTIGAVYRSPHVVYYLNGLGRPLCLTPGYFESDRCWFRRAWTLQETNPFPIIGGETGKDVMDKQVHSKFIERLQSFMGQIVPSIFHFLSEMKSRVSTKPLDKIAGLVYPLRTGFLPIYDAKQSPAGAWEVLVNDIDTEFRAELLFIYPEPGDRCRYWRPSWEQLMVNKAIPPGVNGISGRVHRMHHSDADYYEGDFIELGNVRGLGEIPNEPMHRQGEVVINDANGVPHTLKIVADHTYPIPDGFYTLLHCTGILPRLLQPDCWVVGHIRQDGLFEKLSVFRSARDEEADLDYLALNSRVKTFLC
ncbi:hypothetical protein EDD18DRAFT_1281502 [Armillaria luteobubalina]|uniref:Heterokaryon incompatibility domain-containing protein n=1 Tax=Armillaria luteobubalina TaxID=153913 RepID=A0AA39QBY1_9AGAR|nr:hypothetical protein EDD18DRAFT_1281502 [Armillaria luteobubalina]